MAGEAQTGGANLDSWVRYGLNKDTGISSTAVDWDNLSTGSWRFEEKTNNVLYSDRGGLPRKELQLVVTPTFSIEAPMILSELLYNPAPFPVYVFNRFVRDAGPLFV